MMHLYENTGHFMYSMLTPFFAYSVKVAELSDGKSSPGETITLQSDG